MNVLDLFSGIGGFSLGLERAGFQTAAFCEVDETCRKVLRKHWPKTPIFEDVCDLSFLDFEEGEIDVICGGFPCQDISVAGKGAGLSGARSGLWFEYRRLIDEIKPKYVIIENVANLRNKGLITVLQDLWALGYDAEWHIISACGIGAVHRRERIWVIAYPKREGLQGHGLAGQIGETREESEASPRSLRSAFEGLTPYPNDVRLGSAGSSKEKESKWRTKAAARFRDLFGQIISIEPALRRINDGFPARVDGPRRQEIKQLGNAVLPQIPQLIGEAINEFHDRH